MPIITVQLDRVFDVVHQAGQNNESTLFSMQYGGRAYYGLELPGKQTFRDGMVVTALLKREGDWQRIMAWRDHATGKIVRRRSLADDIPFCAAIFFGVIACVSWDGEPVLSMLLAAAAIAMLLLSTRVKSRRTNEIERLLNPTDAH